MYIYIHIQYTHHTYIHIYTHTYTHIHTSAPLFRRTKALFRRMTKSAWRNFSEPFSFQQLLLSIKNPEGILLYRGLILYYNYIQVSSMCVVPLLTVSGLEKRKLAYVQGWFYRAFRRSLFLCTEITPRVETEGIQNNTRSIPVQCIYMCIYIYDEKFF